MSAAGPVAGRHLLARLAPPWRRGFAGSCDEVREALPAILDGEASTPVGLVDHVEYCLKCQAELARFRRLLRLLHQLRNAEVAVPPGIVTDVLSALEDAANRRAVRSLLAGRRLAYAGGVLGAGTVAVALLVLRPGRGRTGLRGPAATASA